MKPWLESTGSYKVEKIPCPDYGTVDLAVPPAGVLHTTEGGWDGSLSVFRQHYAPHFMVGPGRIAQLVALGRMSGALENAAGGVETNRWARVQIEVVGYSKDTPYVFGAKTMDALADLLATLRHEAGIPLSRPFPDAMPPKPWATTSFSRRHAGKWGSTAGWFGHVDMPENSHWDPGYFEWSKLLDLALATKEPAAVVRLPDPGVSAAEWQWRQWAFGEGKYAGSAPFEGKPRPNVPNPVPADWHVRAIKFLKARESNAAA